jgi:hypothetical protein
MGLEPHFEDSSVLSCLPGNLLATDRNHNPGLYPAASRPRYAHLYSKKMGWTMGLEPHFEDSSVLSCLPGNLLATDRNHNPGLYPAASRPRYAHLYSKKWGGRWDSNPRRPESQSGALPTELRPPQCLYSTNQITNFARCPRSPLWLVTAVPLTYY